MLINANPIRFSAVRITDNPTNHKTPYINFEVNTINNGGYGPQPGDVVYEAFLTNGDSVPQTWIGHSERLAQLEGDLREAMHIGKVPVTQISKYRKVVEGPDADAFVQSARQVLVEGLGEIEGLIKTGDKQKASEAPKGSDWDIRFNKARQMFSSRLEALKDAVMTGRVDNLYPYDDNDPEEVLYPSRDPNHIPQPEAVLELYKPL